MTASFLRGARPELITGSEPQTQLALIPGSEPARPQPPRRALAEVKALVPGVLASARVCSRHDPRAVHWRILRAELTALRVAVITLGRSAREPSAVLKVACAKEGAARLRAEATALCALQADPRLADWCGLAPTVLAAGEHAGKQYVLQQLPRGSRASSLNDPVARRRMLRAAAAAVTTFHRQTATTVVAGARSLDCWVGEPLRVVQAHTNRTSARRRRGLERLSNDLAAAFRDRIVRVSWIHGDYRPGNLLVASGGSRVTGIVDWDNAASGQPPQLDLLHLLLCRRTLVRGCNLAVAVGEVVTSGRLADDELEVLDGLESGLPSGDGHLRALTLLYWLQRVAGLLGQTDHACSRVWLKRNVDPVLSYL